MLTSNDYKEPAARCTELASEFSEPTVAEALMALASDYLACRQAAPPYSRLDSRLSSWRPFVASSMAAKNKCLARSNKSCAEGRATKKSICQ